MEIWDAYDEERRLKGKTMERGKPINDGDYHIVVHVCIFNAKDEMLIQQRQAFKTGWPGLWDVSVGGSAVAGDSSQTAAERETFEELGYKINLFGKRPHFTINFPTGFDDYYLVEEEVDISKLQLQFEEVQDVKWASKDEILNLINTGKFVPYYKSVIEFMFENRKAYGSIVGKP